jgi:hypothetical protein
MFQVWVKSTKGHLAGISHWPSDLKPKLGILLIPGFSQTKCDLSYFMSKLARKLANLGYYVLQLDPSGHGDSSGLLEEVSLDTLRSDIKFGIDYIRSQIKGNVLCVSRGINCVIASEYMNLGMFEGVAGISPYCVGESDFSVIWNESFENETYELAEICKPYESNNTHMSFQRLAFFNLLGADISNLHGQKISGHLLKELNHYNPISILQKSSRNSLWLEPDVNNKSNVKIWTPVKSDLNNLLNKYKSTSLSSDPQWQYQAISNLCDWIEDKEKQPTIF